MVRLYFHSRAGPTGTGICPREDFLCPSRGQTIPRHRIRWRQSRRLDTQEV
jgi:hypothetical protein